jgi:hypothetical protein
MEKRLTPWIVWLSAALSLTWLAGCHRRYVISSEDARLAAQVLAVRGVAEVPARDEEQRQVIIQVRASDDYRLEGPRWSGQELLATDAISIGGVHEVVLYHDRLADDLLVAGLVTLGVSFVVSAGRGISEGDWTQGLPLAGPWFTFAQSLRRARTSEGNLGAAASVLFGLAQLGGLSLVVYAAVTWHEGREVEPPSGVGSVTISPAPLGDGGTGATLQLSF